eukprot:16232501-Heterocapsa_arctica.AAC.1
MSRFLCTAHEDLVDLAELLVVEPTPSSRHTRTCTRHAGPTCSIPLRRLFRRSRGVLLTPVPGSGRRSCRPPQWRKVGSRYTEDL